MGTRKQTYTLASRYQRLNQTDISGQSEVIPDVYLGSCQVSEMRPIVGVVEFISPLMCGSHWWVKGSLEYCAYHILEPYIMLMGPLFKNLAMSLASGTFLCVLVLAILRKHLTDDYRRGMAWSYVCDKNLGALLE